MNLGLCNQSVSNFAYPIENMVQTGHRQLGWDVKQWYFRRGIPFALEELAVPLQETDVRIEILGKFGLFVNNKPLSLINDASRKMMIMLALSEGKRCARETLAGIIWPDTSREKSLANLRQIVLKVKRELQVTCGDNIPLKTDNQSIKLVNCSLDLDTTALLNTISQSREITNDRLSWTSTGFSPEIQTGSDLFVEWINEHEREFNDELKRALQGAVENSDSAVVKLQYAELLSTLDPCNELACRTKMKAHHGNGEKAEALKCYADLWRSLEELFDVEPSSATQELAVAIKIDESRTENIELATQIFVQDDAGMKKQGSGLSMREASSTVEENTPDAIVPRVAVIPFVGRGTTREQQFIGEVLADDLINILSTCKTISVISRLSSSVFSGITGQIQAINLLKVQYLMSGSYRLDGRKIILDVEFSCADTASILWQKRFTGLFSEFLQNDHPFVVEALQGMGIGVMTHELRKTHCRPMEELKNYTVLISAIALMHRFTLEAFKKSKTLFETLIARNRQNALPYAYLSQWYALKVGNGWSDNPTADAVVADQLSKTALDLDPFLSLAHTFRGSVNTIFKKDLPTAERDYSTALEYNSSDPLAWLFRGTVYAFQGKGKEGVSDTSKAIALSPFDPHRYFYYSLAATALLIAGDYKEAIKLSERSLRLNGTHTSSLRALTMALWKEGREVEAKAMAHSLLEIQPRLTVSSWLKDTPCAGYPIADELASALLSAGIPKQ